MKCPGQDSRYWKPGAIFEAQCPQCGNKVEFFKDDPSRLCKNCGHRFLNPEMDFGCASYCKYADQCVGSLSPELLAQRENLLKDRVAIEMKRYFRQDFKRIGHATRTARYAEVIGKEEGGDLAVILTAAYLHDMGGKENQEDTREDSATTPSMATSSQIAREILTGLGAREPLVEEACDIISHLAHPTPEATVNFKTVYDAELIARIEERQKHVPVPQEELETLVETSFLTVSGGKLARKILLPQR
jgi:hypothetical protein